MEARNRSPTSSKRLLDDKNIKEKFDTDKTSTTSEDSEDTCPVTKSVGENDWPAVNKKLRENGLPAVKIQHPAEVQHTSGNMVCLDRESNKAARDNFISLMSDCEHRQTLVQDLITKNNQLKEELARQTELTEKYFTKMKDLKIMLESSRSRVKELESEEPSRSSAFPEDKDERVTNTRSAMHARNKQLEYKCQAQEKELERLKQKVHNMQLQQCISRTSNRSTKIRLKNKELERLKQKVYNMQLQEDKRSQRVGSVFQEFRRRTARAHNTMDDKLLDVIDAYEKQIQTLQKELRIYKLGNEPERSEDSETDDMTSFYSTSQEKDTTPNFKSLIRAYEKQIKELEKKNKKLEDEKDLMSLDVDARPEVKDYRVAQLRIKKLEKLLALHNISIPGEKLKTDPYRLKRKFSTRVEDLDYLPLDLCHQYLKDISSELEVKDLETMVPRIQRMANELAEVGKYEQFCHTVCGIVSSLSESKKKEKMGSGKHKELSSNQLNHVVTVIENWKQDEEGLQELQLSMNRLGERVAPWLKIRLVGEPSIAQISETVDKIVYDDGAEDRVGHKMGHEHPSRSVLENIVQHFQTLFDVPNTAGVYPRMNQIFTKLGEVHNVLHTLKNLLGLADDARSSDIVDSVGRLVTQHNSTTVQQLKNLLQTEDLDGVIRRLNEHKEFFPAFFEVMNKLFEILDVRRMDQVIPAVRALKLLAN